MTLGWSNWISLNFYISYIVINFLVCYYCATKLPIILIRMYCLKGDFFLIHHSFLDMNGASYDIFAKNCPTCPKAFLKKQQM